MSSRSSISLTPNSSGSILRLWERYGLWLLFLVAFVCASVFMPNFWGPINIENYGSSVAITGMLACTMLLCLVAGDFDLSIGQTVALGGIVSVMVLNKTGSTAAGLAAGIGVGAVVGAFNGVVVGFIRINALITTLISMQVVRGVAYLISDGNSIAPNAELTEQFHPLGGSSWLTLLWSGKSFHLLATVGWMAIAFVAFGILLHWTIFGRTVLAVGGNVEAAHLAGLPTRRTKLIIFTMQGMMAGFCGVLWASQTQYADPKICLQGLELEVISACVLGGVSLSGGVGSIGGALVGVLIIGIVHNILNLRGVNTSVQYIVFGGILFATVMLDRLKRLWR